MPFAPGADVITLTGTFLSPLDGTPLAGTIAFAPSTRLVDPDNDSIYAGGGSVTLDADGSFSVTLLRTDAENVEPSGWNWQVDEQLANGTRTTYNIELTTALGPTVDLADVAPVGPPGGGPVGGTVTSVNGESGVVVLGAADVGADPEGTADAAVAAHAVADDPHGDRAYADTKLGKSSNLGDLADTSTARSNLGLGTSATRAVGTTEGTVAAGDDARFTGNLPLTGGTLTGPLVAEAASSTDTAVETEATGDTDPRYRVAADGAQSWGPGDSAADTFLYRGGAGVLRTDGSVQVGANLTVAGRLVGYTLPGNYGFKAWAFDPAYADATANPSDGAIMLAAVYPLESFTATRIWWYISTAGSGLDAGQNFVGLYDSAGTQLASVGVDTEAAGTGAQQTTISVPITAGAMYWVAFLFNGTTRPAMPRCGEASGGATLSNINLSPANYRFAQNGTGTALPSTITPASNVAGSSYWAAIA